MCRALDEAAFHTSNHLAAIRRHVALEIGARYPDLANHLIERQQESDLARGEISSSPERLSESEDANRRIDIARNRESDRRSRETRLPDEGDSDSDSQVSRVVARLRDVIRRARNAAERLSRDADQLIADRRGVVLGTSRSRPNRMVTGQQTATDGQVVGGAADQSGPELSLPNLRMEGQRDEQTISMRVQPQLSRDSRITSREGIALDETHREWQREHEEALRIMEQWAREEDNV